MKNEKYRELKADSQYALYLRSKNLISAPEARNIALSLWGRYSIISYDDPNSIISDHINRLLNFDYLIVDDLILDLIDLLNFDIIEIQKSII